MNELDIYEYRLAIERTLDVFDGKLDIMVLNHVIGFWGIQTFHSFLGT